MTQSNGPNEEDRMCFLGLFPERERSGAAKRFLDPIRAGVATPDAVVAAARSDVRAKLTDALYWADRRGGGDDDDAVAVLSRVLAALADHPKEALRCAVYYLAYEALPPEEKAKVKRQHTADALNALWQQEPATEKQKWFLGRLGYDGPVEGLRKREASQLIERLKRGE